MKALNWSKYSEGCVDFACRLIQTPSMTGDESTIAATIASEMRSLKFDDVWTDQIGNVFGKIKGQNEQLGTIVLNSHLDHVDPGDLSLWSVPPYAGIIQNDAIIGRGACDIKGPLAVQIYSMAALLELGIRPRRDVIFCGVVEEEVGGAGALYWAEHLDYSVDLIILGEPSSNQLILGHRGIVEMWVTFSGKSVHASAPVRGQNPNYQLAQFLIQIENEIKSLVPHPILGPTTVAPTVIKVDTTSMNVTPAWTRVLLDFRTAVESYNTLEQLVRRVAEPNSCLITDALALTPGQPLPESDEPVFGFYTPPNDPAVQRARELLGEGLGKAPQLGNYQFATDGRHFVSVGAPIIGFAPGDEALAHTVDERISVIEMIKSLEGHVALLSHY